MGVEPGAAETVSGVLPGFKPPVSSGQDPIYRRHRKEIRAARVLANLKLLDPDITRAEARRLRIVLAELELCIVTAFGESLPVAGLDWDNRRSLGEVLSGLRCIRLLERR